jgi:hypothetical protein
MIHPTYQEWPGLNVDTFISPFTSSAGFVGQVETVMPVACTFEYLKVAARTALPSGSVTFTVTKNGSGTAMAVTIDTASGTATVSNDTAVSFAAGDRVYLTFVRGGGADPSTTTFDFEVGVETSDTNGAIHGWGTAAINMTTGPDYTGALSGRAVNLGVSTIDRVGVAGNITGLGVGLESAPGVGKSHIFTVMKNGVAQDGSGGTVDTRLTVVDANTNGYSTFTLAVTVDDLVSVRHTSTGGVAGKKCAGALTFSSGTANTWNFVGRSITSLTVISGPPLYNYPYQERTTLLTADTQRLKVLGTPLALSGLWWKVSAAPSSGDAWTMTLRKNSVDTAQSVAIADTETEAGGTPGTLVGFEVGDYASVKFDDTGTPSNSGEHFWTFVASSALPIVGSHVFGATGTVTTTRTGLINLDGVTRSVAGSGIEFIGGTVGLIEQGSAPAGVANTAIIFAVDDGSGKTKWMVQFPTGAAQQLSIEV